MSKYLICDLIFHFFSLLCEKKFKVSFSGWPLNGQPISTKSVACGGILVTCMLRCRHTITFLAFSANTGVFFSANTGVFFCQYWCFSASISSKTGSANDRHLCHQHWHLCLQSLFWSQTKRMNGGSFESQCTHIGEKKKRQYWQKMPEMCFQGPEPMKRRSSSYENANTGRKTPVVM